MITTERDLDVDRAYRLGTIVGAAIVAWGDAMRGMLRRARALEWAKARDPEESVLAQGECEYSESGGKRGCEGSTIETAHAWSWSPGQKDDRCEDCGILGDAFDAIKAHEAARSPKR